MNNNTSRNSRFAKKSEMLNSSFVHLMKFSTEYPCLRKPANGYAQP
jgi:hypothetical protein